MSKVFALVASILPLIPLALSHNEPPLWPKGIVNYHFDKNFSAQDKTFIEAFMKQLEEKLEGCIKFKSHKSGRGAYFHIHQGVDCSSGLGFSPKSQMMVINPEKCLTPSKLEEVLLEGIGVDSEHREGGMGLENVKKIYKCER